MVLLRFHEHVIVQKEWALSIVDFSLNFGLTICVLNFWTCKLEKQYCIKLLKLLK